MKSASLSASLLARKGEARPSMKRSMLGIPPVLPAPVSFFTSPEEDVAPSLDEMATPKEVSDKAVSPTVIDIPVANEQDSLEQTPVSAESSMNIMPPTKSLRPVKTQVKRRYNPVHKKRSKKGGSGRGENVGRIHTSLRIDEELHLRLRLYGAKQHESLQTLMVKALSRYLDAEMGEGTCVCGGAMPNDTISPKTA